MKDPLDSKCSEPNCMNGGRARRALLVGGDPKSNQVYFGVKLAIYRGRSINRYELETNTRVKKGARDLSPEEMDEAIAYYLRIGHSVEHPQIPEDAVRRWVAHFLSEARRLGLEVIRRPTPE